MGVWTLLVGINAVVGPLLLQWGFKSMEFRTAFHQIEDNSVRFPFNIDKIDSFLNLLLLSRKYSVS
jgi:hypothetical protein